MSRAECLSSAVHPACLVVSCLRLAPTSQCLAQSSCFAQCVRLNVQPSACVAICGAREEGAKRAWRHAAAAVMHSRSAAWGMRVVGGEMQARSLALGKGSYP